MIDTKLKSYIISVLRRASYKWKPRNEALKKAKVAYGKYTCNICKQVFARKEVVLDHARPVVDVLTGFQGFDIYIERMFCGEDGFQVICSPCHDIKSTNERVIRQANKKANKCPKITKRVLTKKKKRSKVK